MSASRVLGIDLSAAGAVPLLEGGSSMTRDEAAARIAAWKTGEVDRTSADASELEALRVRLASEFADLHGWTYRALDWIAPGDLAGVSAHRASGSSDFLVANAYAFRHPDGLPAAIAGHVYNGDQQSVRRGLRGAASRFGLRMSFPTDFPSWWFPGGTTLVLFEPQAAELLSAATHEGPNP